jgi:peptidyl-tRNA hydrolase, PTH1 family
MISLVLGLGNVGDRYTGSRHNIGFAVIDEVAVRLRASRRSTGDCWWRSDATVGDRQITLAWPTTLMNRSGLAAAPLVETLGISPAEMLVVVDDFNLPLGAIRFRERGSDGGHNGLASLVEYLGTVEFPRLRLGVGPIVDKDQAAEFVLSPFADAERETVRTLVDTAAEAVVFAIAHRLQEAMSKYNVSPALPDDTDPGKAV